MIIDSNIPDDFAEIVKSCHPSPDEVALLDTVIVIYRYVDEHGNTNWNYKIQGNLGILETIGLMETAKLRMMTHSIKRGLEDLDVD